MMPAMSEWHERLEAAESRRADSSAYWTKAIPALFRDHLTAAAEEFTRTVGKRVAARWEPRPAEHKVLLGFDDWHLGEWTMTVQLLLTTKPHAWVEITCPPSSPRRIALPRDLPNPTEMFLEWMTDAYVERIERDPT